MLEQCAFFWRGVIKDCVYIPPLPNDFLELTHKIKEVIVYITTDLLTEIWEGLDFMSDVYCKFKVKILNIYLKKHVSLPSL